MNEDLLTIVTAVAGASGWSASRIMSCDRTRSVARSRHVVMWAARRKLGLSYPAIGAALWRDHRTVMHGIARVENLLESGDQYTKRLVDAVGGIDAHVSPRP